MTAAVIDQTGYSPETHPKLFKKHGADYMRDRAAPFIDQVASRIAVMDGVGRCEYIEISDRSTEDHVIVFADFDDGVRLWVKEGEIERPVLDRWRDREQVHDKPRPWGPV